MHHSHVRHELRFAYSYFPSPVRYTQYTIWHIQHESFWRCTFAPRIRWLWRSESKMFLLIAVVSIWFLHVFMHLLIALFSLNLNFVIHVVVACIVITFMHSGTGIRHTTAHIRISYANLSKTHQHALLLMASAKAHRTHRHTNQHKSPQFNVAVIILIRRKSDFFYSSAFPIPFCSTPQQP